MPAIVDKERVRLDILLAFERCIQEKPLSNISLRDIAKEARMTHPKLLNYFESRDDLIRHYCKYTQNYMSDHCRDWFESHERENYESITAYLNAFLQYVANSPPGENRPNATTQFYVLARYDPAIRTLVQEEFRAWKDVMMEYLVKIIGDDVGEKKAEAMMILIAGIFICNYNGVLTGEINGEILSTLVGISSKDMPKQDI